MGEMNNPLVCAVIVTWNNEGNISACLKKLQNQSYKKLKVIVVDNASKDNTVGIIESRFPEVEVVKSQKNTYFTGGNNIGYKLALEKFDPEYILLINPDTEADSNMVEELLKVAVSDEKIGGVGPKIKFMGERNVIYSAGVPFDGFNIASQRGNDEEDNGQFDNIEEMDCVEGTCMLLRVKMLKEIGLFWEKMGMYLEDVEFCIRAKKKGWKFFYTFKALLYHEFMSSTKQNKDINVQKLKQRNWLLIALRHYKIKSKIAAIIRYIKKIEV